MLDHVTTNNLFKLVISERIRKRSEIVNDVSVTQPVRVNSDRTDRSDHKVGAGDVLTMSLHGRIVIWRILDCGTRRGPATEAQRLYEDLSPAPLPREELSPYDAAIAQRDDGAGRPTKKERRDTDRLRDGND